MSSIENQVKLRFPELFYHLEENEVEFLACFSHYFLTFFLYDTPLEIGLRIFDLFLLEGERVLAELIIKTLALKEEKILALASQDLFFFLRKMIVKECFEEYSFNTLFSCKKVEKIGMGLVGK